MHNRRRKRLEALIGFLRKGNRPSFEELQAYLSEVDRPLKTRQLREDLRLLREEGLDGQPFNITMKGYKGLQFSYKFTRTDNELLNTVKKNRFTARRVILFMDKYIAEINWEYVPDENHWNEVVLEQLKKVEVR